MTYHSAAKTPYIENFKQRGKPRDYYKDNNINAFIFNVETDNIPKEFYKAEFVYLDLPYRKGYNEFNKRAKKKGKGYNYLANRTLEIVKELNLPFYIIAQKNTIKELKEYKQYELGFSVHNGMTTCLYSNDNKLKAKDTDELLKKLFIKYDLGLDFMCGYGNTGKYAIANKKKAILTDFNKKCIGYLYEIF